MEPVRLAVFVSGSGSNLQAILDSIQQGRLRAEVVLVVSNNSDAYGLVRAREQRIVTHVIKYPLDILSIRELLNDMTVQRVECVLLAGFLRKIPNELLHAYANRILNIHPALLPKFGGRGMYGHHVHEAVIAAGEKFSGATVHLVNERYDDGEILAQERVSISQGETPESLAARVMKIEHLLYPKVVQQFIEQEFQIAPVTSAAH